MKTLLTIKKSILVLAIFPFLSLASLYANDSSNIARGGEHRSASGMHHEAAGHHGLERHGLEGHHGLENRAAFNRGAEAGAVEGAAVGGAGVAAPVYIQGQPQVQYVTPQTLPPQ